jgi:hypothetical protein
LLISTDLRASDELTEEKINLLNNLAECLLKLERWRDAEKRATEVLEMKSENQKALWRRGRARVKMIEVRQCVQ